MRVALSACCWFWVWFVVLTPAIGQPAPLSLQQAIDTALASNPPLLALAAEVRAAEARVAQAAAMARRPVEWEGSLEADARQNIEPLFNYTYIELHNDLSRVISDGGKARATRDQSQAEADLARASYVTLRNELVFDVTQAYWDWVASVLRLDLAREEMELVGEQLRIAQIAVAQGDAPALDVLRVQSDLDTAQAAVQEAQADVEVQHAALRVAMGAWPDQAEAPSDALADVPVAPVEVTGLLEQAYERSPLIAEALAQVDLAAAGRTVATLIRRPEYTLRGGYTLGNSRTGDRHALTLALEYRYTVRDHGARDAAVQEAEALMDRANLQVALAKLQTRTDLERVIAQLNASAQRAQTLRQAVEVATTVLDKTNRGYLARAVPLIDTLEARSRLTELRRQYLEAVLDYNLARAALDRVLGRNAQ